jgi:hypothetical protein
MLKSSKPIYNKIYKKKDLFSIHYLTKNKICLIILFKIQTKKENLLIKFKNVKLQIPKEKLYHPMITGRVQINKKEKTPI